MAHLIIAVDAALRLVGFSIYLWRETVEEIGDDGWVRCRVTSGTKWRIRRC